MIKLSNILYEEESIDYVDSNIVEQLKDLVQQVKKNCSNIINYYKKTQYRLIRGSRAHRGELFFIRKPHKTIRKTKDTSPLIDVFMEYYRQQFFPNIPSRQKSIFCLWENKNSVGSEVVFEDANYGTTFIVYPANGMNLFQSKATVDFYASELYREIEEYLEEFFGDNFVEVKIKKILQKKDKDKFDKIIHIDIDKEGGNNVLHQYFSQSATTLFHLEKEKEIILNAKIIYHIDPEYINVFEKMIGIK